MPASVYLLVGCLSTSKLVPRLPLRRSGFARRRPPCCDQGVTMPKPAATSETSSRILDVAERLVQTRGFNAFSYADISRALHITKASLHYHFPTKAKLGERLIERYQESFLSALTRIDQSGGEAGAKLRAYVDIYTDV